MKVKHFIFYSVIFSLLSGSALGNNPLKSEVEDQTAIHVTVYKHLGLIKDVRNIKLPVGEGELRFMDVASFIMPATVHVKSLNNPTSFTVLEQNYEYDLINADKLLDKYVGEKIKIIDWNRQQDRKNVVEAILLSNNEGQVYKIDDEVYLGHPGYKVLPEIPGNLIAKPTLMWLYKNRTEKAHKLEVSYLTKKISWKADYVLTLNKNDTFTDITGWVSLDNNSGTTYNKAKLKLVAGEVHQAEEKFTEMVHAMKSVKRASTPEFEERQFFEYHIYDLKRKTTIKDKQTKQVNLLESADIEIQKEFVVQGIKPNFVRKNTDQKQSLPVNVYMKMMNSEKNNLGLPLPAGIMRLYKQDHEGSLQFIGEDKIEHTPKDEEICLKIGKAFDIVSERTQTDYKRITSKLHETEWEITLKNHKEKDIQVRIIEPLFGNWDVVSNSHPFSKVDSFTIEFNINIPKDKEIKVKYRVRTGL